MAICGHTFRISRALGLVWICAVASNGPIASQTQPWPPNILLIQADDLGYGDLSAYGQTNFQTPVLDRLAREGIRFTRYYAGSTVCAPSRAALMTGRHTGHGWIRGNGEFPLRAEDVTVGTALRDAGYRTAVIGKWGLGRTGTTGAPDRKGFAFSFGFLDHRHAHRQYTDHLYRDSARVATDVSHDYVNDLFTREASAFIERADDRPFFVYLNYTVPHAELRVPADSLAPLKGRFPEKADSQSRVRGDGDAHGPRHRPPDRSRCGWDAGRVSGSGKMGRWSCTISTPIPRSSMTSRQRNPASSRRSRST
jgi:arylsulfatase A